MVLVSAILLTWAMVYNIVGWCFVISDQKFDFVDRALVSSVLVSVVAGTITLWKIYTMMLFGEGY